MATAQEMADKIGQIKETMDKRNLIRLKKKSYDALNEAIEFGEFVFTIDLSDEDLNILSPFTDELREMNYKYCLIETVTEEGELVGHRLRISMEHLRKDNSK